MTGPIFTARYGGRCAECDERIAPGDDVTYVDDCLAHAGCPEPAVAAPARPAPPPCPSCRLVHAGGCWW